MAGADPGAGWDLNEDPRRAGVINVAGDQAAMLGRVIQMLAAQNAFGDDPENVLAANTMVENCRRSVVAASRLARASGQQRKPDPMTILPAEWGDSNLDHVRANQISKFQGTSDDPTVVYTWLESCVAVAEANTLSEDSFLGLLRITSDRSAAAFLSNCRRSGYTAYQTVQEMEMRYGDLCTPSEALKRLSQVRRKFDVPVRMMVDELTRLARFATRDIEDADIANERVQEHVKIQLLRLVRPGVRKNLSQLMEMYAISNNRGMDTTEMESAVNKLESELQAEESQRFGNKAGKWQPNRGNQQANANQVEGSALAAAASRLLASGATSEPESDSEEEGEIAQAASEGQEVTEESDPILGYVIAAIQEKKKKSKKPQDMKKLFTSAVKQYNKFISGAQEGGGNAGPPSKLNDRQRITRDLLKAANIQRGECILCGRPGHIMGNVSCPMRGKKMVTRACTMCGKGLHDGSDCIAGHIDPRMAINQAGEEDYLNEN